jgi:hypothetical protein
VTRLWRCADPSCTGELTAEWQPPLCPQPGCFGHEMREADGPEEIEDAEPSDYSIERWKLYLGV